ncbi:TetR/AcrR family transcriptional regulator [Bradyrhizobium sp. INPA01-394B]|uniref:TetR/AcrR family transcriptional regulator n=1 Tax=Bradyrhizobium campsiandrae TaxID=1729892 RepID=A0ABR7UHE9_9BRAD|nr:TetR/AcrR family transcriptional regulator [Bradyrhizobium campsiandrae]MBC9878987.1 TetR/AcrR family transcriptional regulator [Bradyrhizobium campsiandrae]MBC9982907.1 TetR/AcrR family transcriptional regulator [Bradyrhizobium campsiandrae]
MIGRPREFDPDVALDQALTLFWSKGYEATSMMDLVEVIGANKPSLYAVFGSKEELFLKVLERYQSRLGAFAAPSLTQSSARNGLEAFLRALATFQSGPATPAGCLLVQGALVGSEESRRIAKVLCEVRESGIGMIRSCLERARQQRELPPRTDVDALARYFGTVSQGISVQAASGVPTRALHDTIKIAMRAWPEP